jgi:multidrug efflux pump subunit AcrA (membrane-fusion protein)
MDSSGMAARLGKKIAEIFSSFITIIKGLPALLKHPQKRWRVILPSLAILAIAGGALYYYETAYLPSQRSAQPTLQTTVARRGDIILSASGTGTLQAANQIDLGFKSGGKLTRLDVKVGDQIQEGQLLAELDNTSQQIQYEQAKQNLESLTSVSAIGAAQQSLATATQNLQYAELQVAYLVSPDVYYWENEITKDEQVVKDAQAAAEAAPSNKDAQDKLKKAKDLVGFAEYKLKNVQKNYHDYVLDNFTVNQFNHQTNQMETFVMAPTAAEILKARQDVTIAQGTLNDAQNLYAALTGGDVPPDASGSGIQTLQQAKLDLQTAQDNLQATQLFAPFSGTVVSVSAQLGDTLGTTAIISIADLSKLYLQTYVDESDYDKFKVGNSANIVFDALPDQTLTGKVVQVSPALDTSSGSSVVSGLVELDPTTADLLIGMGASVEVIAAQTQNAVLIPLAALHAYSPGKYAVFVMRNGKLTVQFVEVGLQDLVNAEIKSGLQPGDIVSTGLLGTKQQ